jgi:hypothetical protein
VAAGVIDIANELIRSDGLPSSEFVVCFSQGLGEFWISGEEQFLTPGVNALKCVAGCFDRVHVVVSLSWLDTDFGHFEKAT